MVIPVQAPSPWQWLSLWGCSVTNRGRDQEVERARATQRHHWDGFLPPVLQTQQIPWECGCQLHGSEPCRGQESGWHRTGARRQNRVHLRVLSVPGTSKPRVLPPHTFPSYFQVLKTWNNPEVSSCKPSNTTLSLHHHRGFPCWRFNKA